MTTSFRYSPVARGTLLAALYVGLACLNGCVHEVLSGEDPDRLRPTATGDSKRDMLTIDIPWMEAPIPRLLMDGKPIVAERVSARTPEHGTSYLLRTRTGTTASVLITTKYPSEPTVEFTYKIEALPPGFTLDVPIGLGRVGRRGPVAIAVNGAPYDAPPSVDVAIVNLSRDDKTRITVTRLPDPPPAKPVASSATTGPRGINGTVPGAPGSNSGAMAEPAPAPTARNPNGALK